jgi:hypothetical protein
MCEVAKQLDRVDQVGGFGLVAEDVEFADGASDRPGDRREAS